MFLNQQQDRAVHLPLGTALVLAGAGTGKTAIISQRVVHLIQKHQISPHAIVVITFTNNAAKELRDRIEHQHGITGCWIGTFHRLGYTILAQELPHSLIPQNRYFNMYDDEDRKQILKQAATRMEKEINLDAASQWIHAIKQENTQTQKHEMAPPEFVTLLALYEQLLVEANALDLDDLLAKTTMLLESDADVLDRYRKKWNHFLLDEYQDTNSIQAQFVRLLSGPNYYNFFVGDPDQAIYSWRGATIENILNVPKLFPNTHTVFLEQNYRSNNTILHAANSLIQNNQYRFHKDLWSDLGNGSSIFFYEGNSDIDEAEYVARMVRKSATEKKTSIAILYRSHNISRVIEDALLRNKIPYVMLGGLSFYLRKEIKDVLALLKIVSHSDPVAMKRVLEILPGAGEKTRNQILSRLHYSSATEAILLFLREEKSIPTKKRQSLQSLCDLISSIEKASNIVQKIERAIHSYLIQNSLKDRKNERVQNLSELFSKAALWHKDNPRGELCEFLAMISLNTETRKAATCAPWAQMMTIHYAKGLEFDEVFLVGLEEGVFPNITTETSQKELEEERRLCYVAITRARHKLHLSCSKKRMIWGTLRKHNPSPFLEEIPEKLLCTMRSPIMPFLRY